MQNIGNGILELNASQADGSFRINGILAVANLA